MDGVYGHEQKHVDSLINEIMLAIGINLEDYEKRPCRSKTLTDADAAFANRWYGKIEFQKILDREARHANQNSPKAGQNYPVNGTIPPES